MPTASPATSPAGQRRGAGLVVTNIGGTVGWKLRKLAPGFASHATQAYLAWIRHSRRKAIEQIVNGFRLPGEGTDGSIAAAVNGDAASDSLFSHFEIETINRCNSDCSFCPVNKNVDTRPPRLMAEELFDSLLEQLAILNYSGYLCLYSNNEPLLDPRLADLAARARTALPHAYLNLSTNGLRLSLNKFKQLLPHFDRIIINNYRDVPVMRDNVRQVHDYCRSPEGREALRDKTVEISLRCIDDVLTSRAGTSPNHKRVAKPLPVPCQLPFTQMVVRPDGCVSLCCNDALGQMTLGDCTTSTIMEIWRGPTYNAVRTLMRRDGRKGLPLCRACDFVKHHF
ncbi:MAG: SPASM domain-containing protein [Planctomycetes bacterium]|nr:SPASM domain-containing protein [Planctomycetota bacterium]